MRDTLSSAFIVPIADMAHSACSFGVTQPPDAR